MKNNVSPTTVTEFIKAGKTEKLFRKIWAKRDAEDLASEIEKIYHERIGMMKELCRLRLQEGVMISGAAATVIKREELQRDLEMLK